MTDETGAATPTMTPPASGVKVRMYRPNGLGDCFLLAFRAGGGAGRYMLIDCGVFFRTRGGADRMRAVAADIEAATAGRLHTLVATHEHWDHLSGFQFAEKVFDRMTIDEVWVAWTEDPNHPLANRLREGQAIALSALSAAVERVKAAGDLDAGALEEVLNFHGGFDQALGMSGTADQMSYVRERTENLRYRRPGEDPISLADVPGVKIYVLGPPEDEALLLRSDPSTAESEVYEREFALNDRTAFYASLVLSAKGQDGLAIQESELLERKQPFGWSHRIPIDKLAKDEHGAFFKRYFGGGPKEEGEAPAWRRIDNEWLAAAGELALQLDNDTNNTSLAFAIELVESGKVLLFPGDAQVGNCLSWHNVSWPVAGDGSAAEVSGADLLRRTVLYKVGHHGSHNATLREKGLEMMESPELVAMIPVDQAQAERKDWSMPFPPLLERLEAKTKGRILRTDKGLPERPESLSQEEWDEFTSRTAQDSGSKALWVEYTVPG